MNIGYCIGGSRHGDEVSFDGEMVKLPAEIDVLPDVAIFSMEEISSSTISVERYFWSSIDTPRGRLFFWKYEEIQNLEDIWKALNE